jgi:hypothetical protein
MNSNEPWTSDHVTAIWSRNAQGPSVGSAAGQKGTAAEWKGTMQHCMISESLVVFKSILKSASGQVNLSETFTCTTS